MTRTPLSVKGIEARREQYPCEMINRSLQPRRKLHLANLALMWVRRISGEPVEVLTPQKKLPVEVTLRVSGRGTLVVEIPTYEDDDGLLILKKTAERHSISPFIANLKF